MSLMGNAAELGAQDTYGFAEVDLPKFMSGDDLGFPFSFTTVDNVGATIPIDLRGRTITLTFKKCKDDVDEYVYSVTPGMADSAAESGSIRIDVPRAESQNLVGPYFYDLQVESTGRRQTLMVGRIEFVEDVNDEV